MPNVAACHLANRHLPWRRRPLSLSHPPLHKARPCWVTRPSKNDKRCPFPCPLGVIFRRNSRSLLGRDSEAKLHDRSSTGVARTPGLGAESETSIGCERGGTMAEDRLQAAEGIKKLEEDRRRAAQSVAKVMRNKATISRGAAAGIIYTYFWRG